MFNCIRVDEQHFTVTLRIYIFSQFDRFIFVYIQSSQVFSPPMKRSQLPSIRILSVIIFMSATAERSGYGQGYDPHILVCGYENFISLQNDPRHIYLKDLGKIIIRNDSVFVVPAETYWRESGNTTYVAVPLDSIFFQIDGPMVRPDDCSHCTDTPSMQRCLGWQDTVNQWQQRYPGYELKYTIVPLIHAPITNFTVTRSYTLRVFDQDSMIYSHHYTSCGFNREFLLLCLRRNPARLKIEISNLLLKLMGCSPSLFRYPKPLFISLHKKAY